MTTLAVIVFCTSLFRLSFNKRFFDNANLAATNRLDDTPGYSDAGRMRAVCPMDGPIMAVPHNTSAGDLMYCHACKGIYRLHVAADAFELEPTGQRRFDLQPEIDLKPINALAAFAPNHVLEWEIGKARYHLSVMTH